MIYENILFIYSHHSRHYLVKEEEYGPAENLHITLEVRGIGSDDDGNTWAIINANHSGGTLTVGGIYVSPEHSGLGIETVLMDALSNRFGAPCEPPDVTTDDEDEVWLSYHSRAAGSPALGYLHRVGPWPRNVL